MTHYSTMHSSVEPKLTKAPLCMSRDKEVVFPTMFEQCVDFISKSFAHQRARQHCPISEESRSRLGMGALGDGFWSRGQVRDSSPHRPAATYAIWRANLGE